MTDIKTRKDKHKAELAAEKVRAEIRITLLISVSILIIILLMILDKTQCKRGAHISSSSCAVITHYED